MTEPRCRLYLITPPRIDDLNRFLGDLDAALRAGDVAALQIRLKAADGEGAAPDDLVRAIARPILGLAQGLGVATLINDRPDLARELGADGVHVGQDDAPYREARRIVGPSASVGVTCHGSRHLAMEAAEAGADYVAFGQMFPSATKPPKAEASIELVAWWAELFTTPCVAIGGLTPENCAPVVAAGADFLAVCGGVWSRPGGPAAAVRAYAEAIETALSGQEADA